MYPPSDDETYGRHMADGIKATEAETGNGNDDEAVETDNGDSDVEEAADEPSTTDESSDDGDLCSDHDPTSVLDEQVPNTNPSHDNNNETGEDTNPSHDNNN
jgi:hypothetical protein